MRIGPVDHQTVGQLDQPEVGLLAFVYLGSSRAGDEQRSGNKREKTRDHKTLPSKHLPQDRARIWPRRGKATVILFTI